MLTTDEIAGLRELERKATPGPWQARFLYRSSKAVRDNAATLGLMLGSDRDWEDAELTAEVRNALPALLDELERLRGQRETLNKLISLQQQAHIDGHAELVAERDAALARVKEIYEDYNAERQRRIHAEHKADWEPKCREYLKDGETPAERLDRYHKEVIALMNMLGNAKIERDAALAKLAEVREVFAYEPDDWYNAHHPGYFGYRTRVLSILGPQPARATADEDARGEAERLAQQFHEAYERLAPDFGYKTREASAKPWADVPEQNKQLMIAVCAELIKSEPIADRTEGE